MIHVGRVQIRALTPQMGDSRIEESVQRFSLMLKPVVNLINHVNVFKKELCIRST
jgi:hypothetical protein